MGPKNGQNFGWGEISTFWASSPAKKVLSEEGLDVMKDVPVECPKCGPCSSVGTPDGRGRLRPLRPNFWMLNF